MNPRRRIVSRKSRARNSITRHATVADKCTDEPSINTAQTESDQCDGATTTTTIVSAANTKRKHDMLSSCMFSPSMAAQDSRLQSQKKRMTVSFVEGRVDLCDGDPDLRIAQKTMNAMAQHYNENELNPCVNSYDYVPDTATERKRVDWRQSDIVVEDAWFVPERLSQVVDNRKSIDALDKWLRLWTARPLILPRRCVAFARGPPGTGKTTAVRLALQKNGFNRIIEINASSERSKKMINERLRPLIMHSSVQGGMFRTAIVLEEVDGLHFGGTSGRYSRTRRSSSHSNGATTTTTTSNAALSGGGATTAIGGGSSGADALVKFFQSRGYKPTGCDRRGLSAETAAAVGNETWQQFRSTVPIIMIANESYAPFMNSLASASLSLRFYRLHDRQVAFRVVNQLSVALNLRWSKPKSDDYFKGVPLFNVLVSHANGDLRKATALLADAVRAAYSRRQQLRRAYAARGEKSLPSDKNPPYLIIKRVDCQAFFGRSKEDVMDCVPTLFGAARFLLCQMRCKCKSGACTCTRSGAIAPKIEAESSGAPRKKLSTRTSVWEQAQRMATHDIRALPDMLFENCYLYSAEPQRCHDVDSRLAASAVRRKMAMCFSDAEALRSDIVYLSNAGVQQFYMQRGMVEPALLARYPHKYAHLQPDSVCRPQCISRTGGGAQINLQKSSLEGENGNASLTLSLSKQERNAYVQQFKLPYQVGCARWYDTDNYVSKVDETRSQKQMLRPQKQRQKQDSDQQSEMEIVRRDEKMSKVERTNLRKAIKHAEAMEKIAQNADRAAFPESVGFVYGSCESEIEKTRAPPLTVDQKSLAPSTSPTTKKTEASTTNHAEIHGSNGPLSNETDQDVETIQARPVRRKIIVRRKLQL